MSDRKAYSSIIKRLSDGTGEVVSIAAITVETAIKVIMVEGSNEIAARSMLESTSIHNPIVYRDSSGYEHHISLREAL